MSGQELEIEPLPPTLEEQDSTAAANPPMLEPEAFIVGNLTGTELLYRPLSWVISQGLNCSTPAMMAVVG